MDNLTAILTDSITTVILKEMDNKLKPIVEENLQLRKELEKN